MARTAPVPASRWSGACNPPAYHYVQPLNRCIDPEHTSSSPVIDANGYVVGLVSGAVRQLGVVAGVEYLRSQLDRYGVAYRR